jgi:hypothetical protein
VAGALASIVAALIVHRHFKM